MSRTAFHVGDELLLADIPQGAKARAEADAELQRALQNCDSVKAAHAVRRAVKARKVEAAELRYSWDLDGAARSRELLEVTECLVEDELARARAEADRAAELPLLLALGELSCRHRNFTHRESSMLAIEQALQLAREALDKRSEGDARVLAALAMHDIRGDNALRHATEAVSIFRCLGDKKCEALALHFMGMSRWRIDLRREGLQTMAQAARLFEAAAAPRHCALEHFAMEDLSCDLQRVRLAQFCPGRALGMLEHLGYDRGFRASALRCKLTALIVDRVPSADMDVREAVEEMSTRGDLKGTLDVKQALVLAHGSGQTAVLLAEDMVLDVRRCMDREWEILLLLRLAAVHLANHDINQAVHWWDEARVMAQDDGDDLREWLALDEWAVALLQNCSGESVKEVLELQQELVRKTGDRMREGLRLLKLCLAWSNGTSPCSESNQAAWECAHQAAAIFKDLGEARAEASACDKMAQGHIICFDDKDIEPEKALEAVERGRELHKQRGNPDLEAMMLVRTFRRIYVAWGKHEKATDVCLEAVKIARSLKDNWLLPCVLSFLLKLRFDQLFGDGESGPLLHGKAARRAMRSLVAEAREALDSAQKSGDAWAIAQMALWRASVALMEDDVTTGGVKTAAHMVAKATYIAHERGDNSLLGAATLAAAKVALLCGDREEAATQAEKALVLAQFTQHYDLHEAVCAFLQNHGLASALQRDEEPADRVRMGQLVRGCVGLMGGMGLDLVDFDTPLLEVGMDSLNEIELRKKLQKGTDLALPRTLLFDFPTQSAIVDHLIELQRKREADEVLG